MGLNLNLQFKFFTIQTPRYSRCHNHWRVTGKNKFSGCVLHHSDLHKRSSKNNKLVASCQTYVLYPLHSVTKNVTPLSHHISDLHESIFGRPFVKRSPYAFGPLSCLSVCVWRWCTVGWIKMKLGMQVGRPGHIVLDGDPAPPPQRAQPTPNFRPISVVAKWLDGLRCHLVWRWASARTHCARRGPSSRSPKKGADTPPIFGPCLSWPNGCMDQDANWYGGKPRPRRHCVRWVPSSPPP